jgi:hypothetical protein
MDPQKEISLDNKERNKALHVIMPPFVTVVNMYSPTDRQSSNLHDNLYGGCLFVCLLSWRYKTLWLYFSQPGSGL